MARGRILDILVDELDGSLWVASVKDNKLDGLEVDPANEEVRSGAIYWAKVTHIDKSLDAAFLDLDGENSGLLMNADVRIFQKDGTYKKGGDVAIGKVLKTGHMIPVQAKSGYLPRLDSTDLTFEDKAVSVSMDITIPGRHLILAPMMAENRISSRITDKKQRKQLLKMLRSVENIQGCILRASAADVQTDILIREGKILKDMWEQIQAFFMGDELGLVMDGPDAVQRSLGDNAHRIINGIEITTMDKYQEVEEWCEIFAPDLVTKIIPVELPDHNIELGLFDYRDVLDQIEYLFQPYVILKNTGNIIIQETAALTAIDVNRGGDKRDRYSVNIEAATEIGRQLRLRNLGGIIVIDFLKMTKKKDRDNLISALKEIAAYDPCTVQVHSMTSLGLVEITRKRRTPALQERFDSVLD
ncbi:MAG: ribonuclease E/G [Alphaproteobacteria bacterium]|nr:ribonuclease E/G [Alphaproteobacteria bacterium]